MYTWLSSGVQFRGECFFSPGGLSILFIWTEPAPVKRNKKWINMRGLLYFVVWVSLFSSNPCVTLPSVVSVCAAPVTHGKDNKTTSISHFFTFFFIIWLNQAHFQTWLTPTWSVKQSTVTNVRSSCGPEVCGCVPDWTDWLVDFTKMDFNNDLLLEWDPEVYFWPSVSHTIHMNEACLNHSFHSL